MLNKTTFTFYLPLRIVMNTYTFRQPRMFEVFSRFKFGWTQKKIGGFRTFARSRAVIAYETSFMASRLLLLPCIFLWHFLCSLRLMLLRMTIFCVQRRSRQLTTLMSVHSSRPSHRENTECTAHERIWWNDTDRLKSKYPKKTCQSAMNWSGIESGPSRRHTSD